MAAGFLAVAGHCYPIFHRFRGGKGVATAAGVAFWTMPIAGAVLLALWFLLVKLTKTASIASLVAMGLAVPAALLEGLRGPALLWLAAILVLVIWRHRANIKRMLGGSEEQVPA